MRTSSKWDKIRLSSYIWPWTSRSITPTLQNNDNDNNDDNENNDNNNDNDDGDDDDDDGDGDNDNNNNKYNNDRIFILHAGYSKRNTAEFVKGNIFLISMAIMLYFTKNAALIPDPCCHIQRNDYFCEWTGQQESEIFYRKYNHFF